MTDAAGLPRRQLEVRHAVALCVGTVVGSGIFRASPEVAANVAGLDTLFLVWLLGAVLSLLGALCFAEMAAAFPSAGGDYAFLAGAYGQRLARLFAWSRFAVIHTGSMALLAFVFGDYLAHWWHLGHGASAAIGATAVIGLTLLNLRGVRLGIGTQMILMGTVSLGLSCVAVAGLTYLRSGAPAIDAGAPLPYDDLRHAGSAMIFVLLAYGGWSDAATLSAEMRDERRGIVWALIIGLAIVALLYLGANWSYVRVLGLGGLAASSAPAADVMRVVFGPVGEALVVGTVATAAISVMNALLMVGARTTYAAMKDWRGDRDLGHWDAERGTPPGALLAMSAVALVQIGFGSLTLHGFSTMVDFMTPVYWFFLSLSGLAVIVLRRRRPDVARPFRVPGYPLTPLLFFGSSLYMRYSSQVFVRPGAWVGVGVLACGAAFLWRRRALDA